MPIKEVIPPNFSMSEIFRTGQSQQAPESGNRYAKRLTKAGSRRMVLRIADNNRFCAGGRIPT